LIGPKKIHLRVDSPEFICERTCRKVRNDPILRVIPHSLERRQIALRCSPELDRRAAASARPAVEIFVSRGLELAIRGWKVDLCRRAFLPHSMASAYNREIAVTEVDVLAHLNRRRPNAITVRQRLPPDGAVTVRELRRRRTRLSVEEIGTLVLPECIHGFHFDGRGIDNRLRDVRDRLGPLNFHRLIWILQRL
jgi:hypothetical protein